MQIYSFRSKTVVQLMLTVGVFVSGANFAQATDYKVPRNGFGQPDLQGVWTNATMTPFERPKSLGKQLIISPERAKELEDNNPFERYRERDSQPTDPNAPAPKAGNIGGYNTFWMDPGTKIVKVNGEYHTSLVVSPDDGQIPYTEESQKILDAGVAQRRSEEGFDGPEVRALGERCLVGFGSTGGPPMLPVLYNNHYQIVQSQDHVAIMVEMNHDVRIIRLGDQHQPASMTKWLGDSVGHWEGDTLVVTTRQIHPSQEVRIGSGRDRVYIPKTATVIERFTRVGKDEIYYQFTVEDEDAYTSSWSAEMPLLRTPEQIFEYACHEGNYALPGILAGARKLESEGRRVGRD